MTGSSFVVPPSEGRAGKEIDLGLHVKPVQSMSDAAVETAGDLPVLIDTCFEPLRYNVHRVLARGSIRPDLLTISLEFPPPVPHCLPAVCVQTKSTGRKPRNEGRAHNSIVTGGLNGRKVARAIARAVGTDGKRLHEVCDRCSSGLLIETRRLRWISDPISPEIRSGA